MNTISKQIPFAVGFIQAAFAVAALTGATSSRADSVTLAPADASSSGDIDDADTFDHRPGYPYPGYPSPGYPGPGYPAPGYPSRPGYYGSIRDTLTMMDEVQRSVMYRDYNGAILEIRQIQDILSRYAMDSWLRDAQNATVVIARTIGDVYEDDYTKRSVTDTWARTFRNDIFNSEAYRRDNGYTPPYNPPYNPPPPPYNPPPYNPPPYNPPPYNPPYGGREVISCSSFRGERQNCESSALIRSARVLRQYGAMCVQGSTWNVIGRSIWVSGGCRADFEVTH